MNPKRVKEVAAGLLNVGTSKVWLSPLEMQKISEALTKEDVRGLMAQGLVRKRKDKGQSRARARALREKKRAGRKRGHGKRAGTRKARMKPKERWANQMRTQRAKLRALRKEGKLAEVTYRQVYLKIKGNYFRGAKHLEQFVTGGK